MGFNTYVQKKRTKTTEDVEQKRLDYCNNRRNENWSNYVFVDESSINIKDDKGRSYFKSKKENKLNPKNYKLIDSRSIKVNLFGVLTKDEFLIFKISNKFNSANYYNLLKDGGIIDYLILNYPAPIYYLHDHSTVHDQENVTNYINNNLNLVTDWPTYSPDLNIIEKVWNILKDNVRSRLASLLLINNENRIKNEQDLYNLCLEEASKIKKSKIDKLYKNLPHKIKEVIKIKGKTVY